MFKYIHAADIHLDSPLHKLDRYEGAPAHECRLATRRALDNLVRLACSQEVAFVLIAGDLYDGDWKDYNTGLYLVDQMLRLRGAGIPVFIVAGNHDAASRITKTIRMPDNVYIFPADHAATHHVESVDVAIHGQSFASPVVKKDLSLNYPNRVAGCFNVGLLHTCASGREGHEPYAPCSIEGLRTKGYDYWALGHVHQYETLSHDPPIVFSGNTQGRHARETGPKGCLLITVDNIGRTESMFKPLDVVRWITSEIDASGATSGYDVVDRFSRGLAPLLENHGDRQLVIRTLIKGKTQAYNAILSDVERWKNEIRAASLELGRGRVWVEQLKFAMKPMTSKRVFKEGDGPLGTLSQLFDELTVGGTDKRRELVADLAEMEKKIPRELKMGAEGIRFGDDQWFNDLVEQVRPMLMKRLLEKEKK